MYTGLAIVARVGGLWLKPPARRRDAMLHSMAIPCRTVAGGQRRYALAAAVILAVLGLHAEEVAPEEAARAARAWLGRSPLFLEVSRGIQPAPQLEALQVVRVGDRTFYHAPLSPRGYVVLNSDTERTPVLAFSVTSDLNLRPALANGLRGLFERNAALSPRLTPALSARAASANAAKWETLLGSASGARLLGGTAPAIEVAPLLATRWDQCQPYNRLCPAVTNAIEGYDGRAPAGCGPTALAQAMRFHRWPAYGFGLLRHEDTEGTSRGVLVADLAQAFEWSAMRDYYGPWDSTIPEAQILAVARLEFALGVGLRSDYEYNGSSAYLTRVEGQLSARTCYETGPAVKADEPGAIEALRSALRQHRPVPAFIPAHELLLDGFGTDMETEVVHVSYGWGGDNDGWYTLDNVLGRTIDYWYPGFQPQCVALPKRTVPATQYGDSIGLSWDLPAARQGEVLGTEVVRQRLVTADWGRGQPISNLWVHTSVSWFATPPAEFSLYRNTNESLHPLITTREVVTLGSKASLQGRFKPYLSTNSLDLPRLFVFHVLTGDYAPANLKCSGPDTNGWYDASADLHTWADQPVTLELDTQLGADNAMTYSNFVVTGALVAEWDTLVLLTGAPQAATLTNLAPDVYDLGVRLKTSTGAGAVAATRRFTLKPGPPPSLRLQTNTSGRPEIALTGTAGTYTLQRSDDLLEWTSLTITKKNDTPQVVVSAAEFNAPRRFFRLAP